METNEKLIVVLVALALLAVGALVGLGLSNPEVQYVNKTLTVYEPVVVERNVTQVVSDPRVDTLIAELGAVKELEDDAIESAEDELDEDYLEDILEDLGLDIDEVKSWTIDEDDTEVKVLSYDFDDEDEDKAEVTLKVKVRYTLEEGVDDDYKKVLYVTGVYSLDDGDAEFEFD